MPFDWAPNTPQCLRGIGKSPAFHGSDLPIRAGQPGPSQTTDNACGGLANPRFSRLGFANPSRATGAEPNNRQCLRGIGKSPAFHGSDLPIRAGQPTMLAEGIGKSSARHQQCSRGIAKSSARHQQCSRRIAKSPPDMARICQSEPGGGRQFPKFISTNKK